MQNKYLFEADNESSSWTLTTYNKHVKSLIIKLKIRILKPFYKKTTNQLKLSEKMINANFILDRWFFIKYNFKRSFRDFSFEKYSTCTLCKF